MAELNDGYVYCSFHGCHREGSAAADGCCPYVNTARDVDGWRADMAWQQEDNNG